MSEWIYKGRPFQPPENFSPEDYYGFVYIITNRATGRMYVGKKFFWKSKTLPITKKRKRRQRLKVESDWKTYFGSNKHLQEEVQIQGEEVYYREILHLCKTKGECAYMETKEQFDREVLLSDKYYNGIINCRIGSKSVKNLFTND
jgi:hypothetical protein|tara:strand:+ start:19085 stop:19519 length:435 start_codon:yes stop_codon:yes gene_type:complete